MNLYKLPRDILNIIAELSDWQFILARIKIFKFLINKLSTMINSRSQYKLYREHLKTMFIQNSWRNFIESYKLNPVDPRLCFAELAANAKNISALEYMRDLNLLSHISNFYPMKMIEHSDHLLSGLSLVEWITAVNYLEIPRVGVYFFLVYDSELKNWAEQNSLAFPRDYQYAAIVRGDKAGYKIAVELSNTTRNIWRNLDDEKFGQACPCNITLMNLATLTNDPSWIEYICQLEDDGISDDDIDPCRMMFMIASYNCVNIIPTLKTCTISGMPLENYLDEDELAVGAYLFNNLEIYKYFSDLNVPKVDIENLKADMLKIERCQISTELAKYIGKLPKCFVKISK